MTDRDAVQDDLIEIVAASEATQGKTGPIVDFMLGQMMAGLQGE